MPSKPTFRKFKLRLGKCGDRVLNPVTMRCINPESPAAKRLFTAPRDELINELIAANYDEKSARRVVFAIRQKTQAKLAHFQVRKTACIEKGKVVNYKTGRCLQRHSPILKKIVSLHSNPLKRAIQKEGFSAQEACVVRDYYKKERGGKRSRSPKPKPAAKPKPKPAAKPQPKPAVKFQSKLALKLRSKLAAKPQPQPPAKPQLKLADKLRSRLMAKPRPHPAAGGDIDDETKAIEEEYKKIYWEHYRLINGDFTTPAQIQKFWSERGQPLLDRIDCSNMCDDLKENARSCVLHHLGP